MRLDSFTLERVLTARDLADLPASPLQLAIARAADGREIGGLLTTDELRAHFGTDYVTPHRPALVEIVAGVRGGKSFLAACAAIAGALRADLRALKSHEVPRFSIVAPTLDNAAAVFRLLLGIVGSSRLLSRLCPDDPTSDTLIMRRPDGRVIEICVVAALRGAVTMRSRWSVGFVLDEVALFAAESSGAVINAEELLRAGETRLVPGAQGWLISSPFGPQGLLYDLWSTHFGRPARVLVVHAPTRALNPTFPQEQIDAIRERAPDVAAREYDAAWIDPDTAFLDGGLIDRAARRSPLEIEPRGAISFAMDPATRGNSWTLVGAFAEKQATGPAKIVVAVARQWTGSRVAPLAPDVVIAEIGDIVRRHGQKSVVTDEWSNDAISALARQQGIRLIEQRSTTDERTELYSNVKTLLATERLELPPLPILLADLKGVRRRATSSGVRIDLIRTANGRHCDFAPSVALAVQHAPHARRSSDEVTHAPPVHHYHSPISGGDFGGTWDAAPRPDGLIPIDEYRASRPSPTTEALAAAISPYITGPMSPRGQ